MTLSTTKSSPLWLEIENNSQRRIFELKDDEIVTLGSGKYASFRVPHGPSVGAHFEARGRLIEMVRGYSKTLRLNGAEVEGRALLVGKGSIECDGTQVVVSVHQSRPPHADNFEPSQGGDQGEQEDESVHHAPTQAVPRSYMRDEQAETLAVHVARDNIYDAPTHALPRNYVPCDEQQTVTVAIERDADPTQSPRRIPLIPEGVSSPEPLQGVHTRRSGTTAPPSSNEDEHTAVIGTVPAFTQEYLDHDENAEFQGQKALRSEPRPRNLREQNATPDPPQTALPAAPALGPEESEHTEGIPLEDFVPPTPSSSEIPTFLSPFDEDKPKMGRRMLLVRGKDGRFESPRTPAPPKHPPHSEESAQSHTSPPDNSAKKSILVGAFIKGSTRLGELAQERPFLTYGSVAVGALCLSMTLLGISRLMKTEPSAQSPSAQQPRQEPQGRALAMAGKETATASTTSGEVPPQNLTQKDGSHATTASASKPDDVAEERATDSQRVQTPPAKDLDEAVKHLLAGRYDRAESSYSKLAQEYPDAQALSVLQQLLRRRNAVPSGAPHPNSTPVILP